MEVESRYQIPLPSFIGSTDATDFGFKLYNHSWWSACSNSCTTFQTDVQTRDLPEAGRSDGLNFLQSITRVCRDTWLGGRCVYEKN
ncbi:hypothetical protein YC2023_008997 [Brassica napus]